ncbi:flagellar hook-associated protein FlgL [Comamonas sp. NoAH]|uniref:flagellar hook-associated protein FlgL n=1 Tax=Comamonas halotolerans TaxID=3041496 RepID=UPI0024E13250|nr:flagellar hook-associated protein FlgL [Comamonas sp. NoAH]
MSISRLGTANTYDRTISNISKQQAELSSQMEHASAGKRVLRASDDPVAAAQAERARTRIARVETDQRTLNAQVSTMEYAEATLGDINDRLQDFRELLVQAGNGSYDEVQLGALAQELQGLRDQILGYANRQDSNGLPLFRGLDSQSSRPYTDAASSVQPGQANSGEYTISNSLDGNYAFFLGKTGNGVLAMEAHSPNNSFSTDAGTIVDPATAVALTDPLTVNFRDNGGTKEYSIDGGTSWATFSTPLTVAGMEINFTGTPEAGDSLTIMPSEEQSIFAAMDKVIAALNVPGSNGSSVSQDVLRAISEIDIGISRVSTVRSAAGTLLVDAQRKESTLLHRSEMMENQRSQAEDIDMVKALSDLESQQTAVSAALQTYASIQKLSLFNYIG